MSVITVRNLPEEVHKALKVRAAENGRSTEAEVRAILAAAVTPKIGFGSALAAIGRRMQLTQAEVDTISGARENMRQAVEPAIFDAPEDVKRAGAGK